MIKPLPLFMLLVIVLGQDQPEFVTSDDWVNLCTQCQTGTYLPGEIYLANGINIGFAGTCKKECDEDGPQTSFVNISGHSLLTQVPRTSRDPIVIRGGSTNKELAHRNITIDCPSDSFVSGLIVKWSGTCKGTCDRDGGVLEPFDLICENLVSSGKFGRAQSTTREDVVAAPEFTSHVTQRVDCQRGWFVDGISFNTTGTCRNKCKLDGPSISAITLHCRALSDFVYPKEAKMML